MGLIDVVIVIIIGIGAFRGFLRGFIHQLTSIAGLIIGFVAARALYLIAAEKLALYIHDAPASTLQTIAFIGIWVIVPLFFALIASFFTRAAEMLSLGILNRLLGLLLGAAKWVLIVGLMIHVIDFVDTDNRFVGQTKKEGSMLYYPIKNTVSRFFPTAKNIANEYITL